MQLKKLEFFGFKSFSDRTSFTFDKGVTVIVGPNGCGKSNVVDAIKWILGEQSAKALRGNEMSDVIFNGSNTRPPMGYAEASLTVLNDRNLLPIDYREVCVTRRLYISGESEYLINKQPCRLKDIKELFMDTGVGANCYSLIEQGRVDTLLQANAQERRFVFEEAAGISRYKTKKREALLKLEKVEQNLLRLNDIIEEIRKRLRSVKLQASKAIKYNEYVDRLRNLRISLSLKKYQDFKSEREFVVEQIKKEEGRGEELLARIEDLQTQRDGRQDHVDQLISDLSKSQFGLTNMEAKITNSHDKIGFNNNTIEELNSHKERYEKHINILNNRINEAENEISNLTHSLEEVKNDILIKVESLTAKESEFKQYSFECDVLQQQIDENKKSVIDILHRESSLQNEIGSLSAEKDTIGSRNSKLSRRQEEITSELERITFQRQDLASQKERVLSNIESLKTCLSKSNEKITTLNGEIQSIDGRINLQLQLKGRKESRLEILEDLEDRYEGVGSGVKTILEEVKRYRGLITGIYGIVADLIRTDAAYIPAIEAVLGDKAQILVTKSLEGSIEAINYLKEHDKGQVKFLPLDNIKLKHSGTGHDLNIPGVIGKAADLIKSREEFGPLVEYVFKNTLIVQDFETALTLSKNGNGFDSFVTLAGEVVEPGGTILAGTGNTQTGLISRKTELESIRLELIDIAREIEVLSNEKEKKENEIEIIARETDEIKRSLDEENVIKVSNENSLQKEEFKVVELHDEKEVNESEINEIKEFIENIVIREQRLNVDIKEINDQRKDLEDRVGSANTEKTQKEERKTEIQDQITELKVFKAQKEERKGSISASMEKLKSELQEKTEELTSTNIEIKNCSDKADRAKEEILNLNKMLIEFDKEKADLEKNIVTLKDQQIKFSEQLASCNSQINECNEECREHEQSINEFKLKENEFKIKAADLEERIRDDYNIELTELGPDKEEEEEGSTPLDWESVSQEIEFLKGKVERMGSVNLEAIQEKEELEERESHLTGQMEDLQNSENTLKDIIQKINITSRDLFEKTFVEIRKNFQELFRKLFGGGRGDLILEEGVDVLDAGIEIIAQPPGKELKSITLFSGGEKVMTTIALLFSVFQSKPSPFCILDEVDAALDENNVIRFTRILKEFTKTSQFLIITHNKQTMSVADVLYGVTMEEAGVSKKVSVKFKDSLRKVA